MEEIGGGIEFVVIDTTHALPGELLDFLAVYPYLAPKAVVVFHDVNLNFLRVNAESTRYYVRRQSLAIATKILFCLVGGKKYLDLTERSGTELPNIAAVEVDDRTDASIRSIFFGTQLNWCYKLSEKMFADYRRLYARHYDTCCMKLFDDAFKYNCLAHEICPQIFPPEVEKGITKIKDFLKMARIDIKNSGDANNDIIVETQDENCKILKPAWFAKDGKGQGYVLESGFGKLKLKIKCVQNGILRLIMLGIDRRDAEGKFLPILVDYTRLIVNGKEIFAGLIPAWHSKSYEGFVKEVADGEILEVEIYWQQHEFANEEMLELISRYLDA